MTTTSAYGAREAKASIGPLSIERREPRADDVSIDILFCGICHSDIHQARAEWGPGTFPMVPGHEIVGRVTRVGAAVKRFKAGDLVGVGCLVDSCGSCGPCREHHEQFCEKGSSETYNSREQDKKTPTYGGYSKHIVVKEHFVLRIPEGLHPAGAAPLLCAGITTYSPLRQWNVKPGQRVGVVGLGGLGHMAVKLAAAMGAEVTMISTSEGKKQDAARLGAKHFLLSTDKAALKGASSRFDVIIDTVSADHDLNALFRLLRPFGALTLVGAPPNPQMVSAFALIGGNKRFAGSLIGGLLETQEMLDFCGQHNIVSDIETIPIHQVNEAYSRVLKSDVRYRFVIDLASLT